VRVAVACASPVTRRWVVPALTAAGHDVVDVVDVGAAPRPALDGCDALVAMAAPFPVGLAARLPHRWRGHDRACSEGVRALVATARAAGVRRVVQHSFSFLYADQGDAWVTEESPLCVTTATEPASVGELVVQDYASSCRTGVVLRMGLVVGDSSFTRWSLRAAARGRPIGSGSADGWAHLIHSDDVGPAVAAALDVPTGVYNVGAPPVCRRDLVEAHAAAVGRPGGFTGPVTAWLGGRHAEPLTRSIRVSSARFCGSTGWAPRREELDASWFDAARDPLVSVE
jgi:nucleoside-diphosphate-sugar epimerase